MTFLRRPFLLPAAFLVLATDAALATGPRSGIHVLCDHPDAAEISEGLRHGIAQRFPDRPVTVSGTNGPGATLQLVTTLERSDAVSGYLVWTTADGQTGRTRTLEMSVMDTTPTPAMLRDFGGALATLFPETPEF